VSAPTAESAEPRAPDTRGIPQELDGGDIDLVGLLQGPSREHSVGPLFLDPIHSAALGREEIAELLAARFEPWLATR
jgi:hypothetical protein